MVFTGALIMFSCLGLARFAYTMLLPSMGKSLHLSYDQMGYVGTANFGGYLIVIALLPLLTGRWGIRIIICAGLLILSLCMILIGKSNGYGEILVLYFLTGVGSGLATVPTLILASHWFSRAKRGMATGIIQGGNGMGLVFSGLFVPYLTGAFGSHGWRVGWTTFGILSLAIMITASVVIRNRPEDVGLAPIGNDGGDDLPPGIRRKTTPDEKKILLVLGTLYFIFGATYPIYGTFIVTSIVDEMNLTEKMAGNFWAWIGVLSVFSGPLFGKLSDVLGRKKGLMAVFLIHTISYGLLSFHMGKATLITSTILYGLSIWSIPTIMAAAVSDYLGVERAIAGFSFITIFLGVGQMVGPAVGGVIAHALGSFTHSYTIAALSTAAALVIANLLKEPERGKEPACQWAD